MRSILLLSLVFCAAASATPLSSDHLQVEQLDNPLAVGTTEPRLSWRITASDPNAKGLRQTAYEIQVASDNETLAAPDLWSTGKVPSTRTSLIRYAGKPLTSRTHAVWRVRSWNAEDEPGNWSEPASFSVGLLSPDDWKAEWIASADNPVTRTSENIQNFINDKKRGHIFVTPTKHFRKDFKTEGKLLRASLNISSLGVHTVRINGAKVGDWFLAPGWTSYNKRLNYITYDVTSNLKSADNTIGITLADGWYAGYCAYGLLTAQHGLDPEVDGRWYYGKTPAILAQLELEYADGTHQTVVTDNSWKSSFGPTTEADILMGESYDARREMPGWSSPGFDDSSWKPVVPHPGTTAIITPHPGVPVRPIEELKPVSMIEHKPGVWIFDLGQNISGVVRLKVKGKAGDKVKIRFAEVLHQDGRLSTENLRCARTVDTYTLKGGNEPEVWQPSFTYHGFQYVELTGFPGTPTKDTVTGVVIHSDTPIVGSFACSDPMLNQLYSNVVWTQRANFFDLPTDCPQRDERMGWTGDAQVYVRTASYNANIAAFYTKWLRDLNDDQWDFGPYPNFAPSPFIRPNMHFAAAWGDAGIICPWTIWQVYGDSAPIAEHWKNMERFMDFRLKRDPEMKGTAKGDCKFGDWLAVYKPKTPIEFIDLAYHTHTATLMAEMAEAIGKEDRSNYYTELAGRLRSRFAELHLKPDGSLKISNQSTYAMSIYLDLLAPGIRNQSAARLAELIRNNGNKMTTGFLGTRPLLPALTSTGHHDLAGALMQQKEYPSWGYEVGNGATTIWERWNSYIKGKGVHEPSMNSFSHYAFGAVNEWMFSELGGIDLLSPGYDLIKIAPRPTGDITSCSVATDTRHGKVACSWRIQGEQFHVDFTVPPNSTAEVSLPVVGPGAETKNYGSGSYSITAPYHQHESGRR